MYASTGPILYFMGITLENLILIEQKQLFLTSFSCQEMEAEYNLT